MMVQLIVHGGAWDIPDELDAAHLAGVRRAIDHIYPQLAAGMPALEAVEAAVRILEEDPVFDAGRGSFLNAAGEIELDAMIMDGASLNFGAVAAVQNLLHPVSLAQALLAHPDHCFLVGSGAMAFAVEQGFSFCDPQELLTGRELDFYRQMGNNPAFRPHQPFGKLPGGTVGAVARDCCGTLAAATSTGGTPRKLPGRVGDTPLIGAGTYADNTLGAVSATGWGESIMKVLLAKSACDSMPRLGPEKALQAALQNLASRVKGLAGMIAIDPQGRYGFVHNTPKMAFALRTREDRTSAAMRQEDL